MLDGNEQPVDDSVNAQDFISSIQGDVETTPEIETPEKIGEFETESYFKAMEEISDGSVSNMQQFKEHLEYKNKYSELQQKFDDMQAKQKISPYANDLSKEINEMYRLGATSDEIQHFLNLQKMDISSMSDTEAIKLQMKMSSQGKLSDDDLNSWYEEAYGDPEDELTGAQKVKAMQDAQAARDSLSKFKVDSGQPAAVLKQRQAEQAFEKANTFWGEVVSKTITNNETKNFSVEIGKDDDGQPLSLTYDFPIPKEGRDIIAHETAKWAARNGLRGNEADYQQVKQFSDKLLWAQYGPQIMENAVRHAKSKTTEQVTQKHHNVKPLRQGAQQQNVSQKDKTAHEQFLAQVLSLIHI